MNPVSIAATVPRPLQTLRRRVISIPAIFLGLALYIVLSPVLAPTALVVGALRRDRWALARTFAMIGIYFACEAVGILIAFSMWLGSGAWLGIGRARRRRWYIALQRWWTGALFWGIRRCFSLKVEVEQFPADLGDRRLLVFLRHASILDTLLAAELIANPLRMHLLYVFKRELLSDPCLDIAGGHLGCHFARRDTGDSEEEVRALRHLASNLRPREGVIIYPEGTRWTPAKQKRVLERIRNSGEERVIELASGLERLLPPRLGGPLALIDGAPDSDVLFIAHEGFEGAAKVKDVVRGSIVGRTIRVKAWKVQASDVPADRHEQVEWLYQNWAKIDAWLVNGTETVESVPTAQAPDKQPTWL
jgi:1-acyl-sn-glycerol-3-phosphate acyltransferase